MDETKLIWPTLGCKVGQSDLIAMKLKLDVSCHLPKVYPKFRIDIWNHFEQGKSEGFDSCDQPSKLTQIRFKSSIFSPYDLEI